MARSTFQPDRRDDDAPTHRGTILYKSSSFGEGCAIQALGYMLLVGGLVGVASFGIGSLLLSGVGVALLVLGGTKSRWYECSVCRNRVGSSEVKLCPTCRTVLSPPDDFASLYLGIVIQIVVVVAVLGVAYLLWQQLHSPLADAQKFRI